MSDRAPSMTEAELVSYNLPKEQVESYRQFQETWKRFNLFAPFVAVCDLDDEDGSPPVIMASWSRYSIVVYITSVGGWIIVDTGRCCPWHKTIPLADLKTPSATDWCQTLVSRILMIPHGEGVTDMSHRGNVPW